MVLLITKKRVIILVSILLIACAGYLLLKIINTPYSDFGKPNGVVLEYADSNGESQNSIISNEEDLEIIRAALNDSKWAVGIEYSRESEPDYILKDDKIKLSLWYTNDDRIEVVVDEGDEHKLADFPRENSLKIKHVIERHSK